MQLRSGRIVSKFTSVLSNIKSSWPTYKQIIPLIIETDNVNEFEKHIRWLYSQQTETENVKVNRLIILSISESFLKSSLEIQTKFKPLLRKIHNKLATVDNVVVEFNILRQLARLERIM